MRRGSDQFNKEGLRSLAVTALVHIPRLFKLPPLQFCEHCTLRRMWSPVVRKTCWEEASGQRDYSHNTTCDGTSAVSCWSFTLYWRMISQILFHLSASNSGQSAIIDKNKDVTSTYCYMFSSSLTQQTIKTDTAKYIWANILWPTDTSAPLLRHFPCN